MPGILREPCQDAIAARDPFPRMPSTPFGSNPSNLMRCCTSRRVRRFNPSAFSIASSAAIQTGLSAAALSAPADSDPAAGATEATFSDTVRDVYPPFLCAGRVHACRLDEGRWWEFSTLERYHGLHVQAHAEGIGPDVVASPGAAVESGEVSRTVLWEGARVEPGARVTGCVLGANVTVRRGEIFEDVVVVDRTILGGTTPERGRAEGERWCVPLGAT